MTNRLDIKYLLDQGNLYYITLLFLLDIIKTHRTHQYEPIKCYALFTTYHMGGSKLSLILFTLWPYTQNSVVHYSTGYGRLITLAFQTVDRL